MNISHDQITKHFETFSLQWFGKIVSNHEVSSTILNLYFPLSTLYFTKQLCINMPVISCTGIPPIIFHPYGALIILENKILLNIISLCPQKHNHMYIESKTLTSSYKFSLSRTFFIQIFITLLAMKHSITH